MTYMKIIIRKARHDELKIIQDMNYKLFLWDYDRDPALNIQWPYERAGETYFKKKISGESGVCFVAEQDGKILGYVAGRVDKEIGKTDTLLRSELENIYIEEIARGKGVGKRLTEKFTTWCKANGAQSMLVAAYYDNEDAIEFYKACGFKPFGFKLEKAL
jgi:GNAT superfamily N-acetyltransferase